MATSTIRQGYTLTDASVSITLDPTQKLTNVVRARIRSIKYTNTSATEDVMTIQLNNLNQNFYSDGTNLVRNFATVHLPAQNSTVFYQNTDGWDYDIYLDNSKPQTLNQLNVTILLDHVANSASIDASNPVYILFEFEMLRPY